MTSRAWAIVLFFAGCGYLRSGPHGAVFGGVVALGIIISIDIIARS